MSLSRARLVLVTDYLKELHKQRVLVTPVTKAQRTFWSYWLKTYKADSTIHLLWLLWAVTTVRMKNFLSVAPSVVINLRPMWKSQESISRMVIQNSILVYTFDFRFLAYQWCLSSATLLLTPLYFHPLLLMTVQFPALRPLYHLGSFSLLSVSVFSAVFGVRKGRGPKNWNSRDSIYLVDVRSITFSYLFFPLKC